MSTSGSVDSASIQLPAEAVPIPSSNGRLYVYVCDAPGTDEHVAVIHPEVTGDAPLVRIHSECFTGDVLGSGRCDCQPQLHTALERIGSEGGIVLYLRQEGRGIGLRKKLQAYALQDDGYDTVEANEQLGLPADAREYGAAIALLERLGVSRVRLLTNNPAKVTALTDAGIEVVERVPLVMPTTPDNERYLATKQQKMGHIFE